MSLPTLAKLQQMSRLDLEQIALDGGGATQSPQEACQSEHEFSLDSRLRVIVGSHGHFEGGIVLRIFQRVDHGFCGQAMTKRILPRPSLAHFGDGTGAQTRIGFAPASEQEARRYVLNPTRCAAYPRFRMAVHQGFWSIYQRTVLAIPLSKFSAARQPSSRSSFEASMA